MGKNAGRQITIWISKETKEAIEALATQQGRTKSNLIRLLIDAYIVQNLEAIKPEDEDDSNNIS